MAALYMVIDVSSVTLTKILKIAPLHEAGLWGRLFKHEGHSVIGPPIEGRGFSKFSLEQLQYLYWNTFQDTPSSDYATLLAACVEKVKKLPVDETGLHTLERRAAKLGIQVRIDEPENKLVAKIPTYDTMSAPTTIPVGETKMNDQFNPLDAALAQIESGEAVGAAEVEEMEPAKETPKKKAAAPKKAPAKEVSAKKETEKKPVTKKEAAPAKKVEPKKTETKKAAPAKPAAKKIESKKPVVAEKKAAPKKAETATKKAVKAEAPKKVPAKKASAKPVAKKEKQPTQGGFTRPAPGTLTGKFWDICDAAAKTKAGAVRADVIKKGIDKLGVSPGTASTQFFRWRAFNGLTAK